MSYTSLAQVERRRLVAQLCLRGLTTRETAAALAQRGIKVTHTTVVRDLKRIKEAWINEYAADINTHKAHLRAEHREVRRRLWNAPTPDYALILRSLEGEAKLYDAPAGPAAAPDVELQLSELGLDPAEVLQQVEAMLAGAP